MTGPQSSKPTIARPHPKHPALRCTILYLSDGCEVPPLVVDSNRTAAARADHD